MRNIFQEFKDCGYGQYGWFEGTNVSEKNCYHIQSEEYAYHETFNAPSLKKAKQYAKKYYADLFKYDPLSDDWNLVYSAS